MKNQMIFALGVILLKLFYGEPILSFQIAQNVDKHKNKTPIMKVFIAYRLINVINTREFSNHVKTIVKCVRCIFNFLTAVWMMMIFKKNLSRRLLSHFEKIIIILCQLNCKFQYFTAFKQKDQRYVEFLIFLQRTVFDFFS